MSDELKEKLPNGITVFFFENIGHFENDGVFRSRLSDGYLVVGYSYNKDLLEPSDAGKEEVFKNAEWEIFGLLLKLTLLNKEEKEFLLYGTRKEFEGLQKELQETFGSGGILRTSLNVEEDNDIPYWWYL